MAYSSQFQLESLNTCCIFRFRIDSYQFWDFFSIDNKKEVDYFSFNLVIFSQWNWLVLENHVWVLISVEKNSILEFDLYYYWFSMNWMYILLILFHFLEWKKWVEEWFGIVCKIVWNNYKIVWLCKCGINGWDLRILYKD